jgi:excisionase family DNA binding protein
MVLYLNQKAVNMSDVVSIIAQRFLNSEPYLSARAIAKHLELNLFTVYKMAQRNQIPSHKIGKSRRFKMSEVEAAIQGDSS